MRPLGGIGASPLMSTLCFKGRGIRRIVSRSSRKAISDLAWRWPGRAWCLLRRLINRYSVCACVLCLSGAAYWLRWPAGASLRDTAGHLCLWSHRFCMATMQIRFDLHSEK